MPWGERWSTSRWAFCWSKASWQALQVSSFLRGLVNELLGPILIVVAMFLLGLVEVGISGPGMSEKMRKPG